MTSTAKSSDRGRRPSPALVVSFISLFVALSGTAMAIQANSIGSKQLKRNAVGSQHVKKSSLRSSDLKNGKGVRGADVVDDSLRGADIDESTLDVGRPGGPPSGPAGGALAGQYPNPILAPDSVGTQQLADNAVNSQQLADNAVNGAKVADGSLSGADVANGSLTGLDVADNTLGAADLGPNSVLGGDIVDGQVRAADLGLLILRSGAVGVPAGPISAGFARNCPAGEKRISGGATLPGGNGQGLQSSWPNGSNGWTVIIRNNNATGFEATVYVLCLQA